MNEDFKHVQRTIEILFDEFTKNNRNLFKYQLQFKDSAESNSEFVLEENKKILDSIKVLRDICFTKSKEAQRVSECAEEINDYINNHG